MPTVDFDAPALMAVLDIPEMAGVPPELVEQLRCLVRARKAWGENQDHPVRIGTPHDVRIRRILDEPDGLDDLYSRPRYMSPLDLVASHRHIVDAEWGNGDRLSGTVVQVTQPAEPGRPSGEAIVEIGGKRVAFSLPRREWWY